MKNKSVSDLLGVWREAEFHSVQHSYENLLVLCNEDDEVAKLVTIFLDAPTQKECEQATAKLYRHSALLYIAAALGYWFDSNKCDCSGNLDAVYSFITDYFYADGQFYAYLDNRGAIAVVTRLDVEDKDMSISELLAFIDKYAEFWLSKKSKENADEQLLQL